MEEHYLLDTNILSELRKGERADAGLMDWFVIADESALFVSALTIGEIQKKIVRIRRRDPIQARNLEIWLEKMETFYGDRILPVDREVARRWGELQGGSRQWPAIDALIAATAAEHGLTLVTRNESDFEGIGIGVLNPFD
jgi:predicted nucleic acid-binding protein